MHFQEAEHGLRSKSIFPRCRAPRKTLCTGNQLQTSASQESFWSSGRGWQCIRVDSQSLPREVSVWRTVLPFRPFAVEVGGDALAIRPTQIDRRKLLSVVYQ